MTYHFLWIRWNFIHFISGEFLSGSLGVSVLLFNYSSTGGINISPKFNKLPASICSDHMDSQLPAKRLVI